MPASSLRELEHPRPVDRLVAVLCGVTALVITVLLLRHEGLGFFDQGRFAATVALTICAPGTVLSGWLPRSMRTGPTRFGTAFVLGLGPQLAGWALAVERGWTPFVWLVPLVVTLVALVARWATTRHRASDRSRSRSRSRAPGVPWWGSLTLLGAWLLILRSLTGQVWHNTPLSGHGPWYQDLYWHVSITADAMHHVPPRDPQSAADGTLSYHWFSNAHAAAETMASGVDLDKVSILAWYVPVAAAVLCLVHGLALALARSRGAAALAVVLFVLPPSLLPIGELDGGGTTAWSWLSPSHIFSLPVTVLAAWMCVEMLRERETSGARRGLVVLTGYVVVLCPGSKVSILPMLLGGLLVAAWGAARSGRRGWRFPAACTVGVLLVLAVTAPVFAGGGGGSKPSYGATVGQIRLWSTTPGRIFENPGVMTLAMLAVLGAYLPVLLLCGVRRRRDPAVWFFVGAFGVAMAAMFFLQHPSRSQLYFVRGLVPVTVAYVAWGAREVARDRWKSFMVVAASACGVGVAWHATPFFSRAYEVTVWWLLLVVAVWGTLAVLLVGGLRRRSGAPARVAAVVAAAVLGSAMSAEAAPVLSDPLPSHAEVRTRGVPPLTPDEVTGARILAAHNPRGHLVATNVHCLAVRTTPFCDDRGFWVSAFTRSPVLVGGWGYAGSVRVLQGRDGRSYLHQPYPFVDVARLNDGFFSHPSAAGAAALKRRGVRYLYADERASRCAPGIGAFARLLWRSGGVSIYAVE